MASKVRVADYVAQALKAHGIEHVFMVTGGGAMHLNDAFGRVPGYLCCHHEQACAMAAESYRRMSGKMAAVNVTTGPGGTNAITGVYGAYVDSIAMIVISGQVKWETLVRSTHLPLRQLGDQEVDIVQMVQGITKYAEVVSDPLSIRYHVEKALFLAEQGRPGPVWLDIPINVQATLVNVDELKGFDPPRVIKNEKLQEQCELLLARLAQSERPVVMVGSGLRISHTQNIFLDWIKRMGIPVCTTWNSHDLIWDDHPLYVGRPGTLGDRAGNFAVQNSDFVLVLGSRLNIRQISYSWDLFARHAYKVMVDIDDAELKKPTLTLDLPIRADLRDFFEVVSPLSPQQPNPRHTEYLNWCVQRKNKYDVVLKEYWDLEEKVNPYCFARVLFEQLEENELVVTGDGTACVVTFQAAKIKRGQRLYTNSGCASMGYDLPAAIGAWLAMKPKRLICIAGDGSIQMNLQELQTIATHRMPIKIFILNNQGYHSIRQTQRQFFSNHIVGCGLESGLSFPDFEKLSKVYGFPYSNITCHGQLRERISKTLNLEGPSVCEVILDLNQPFAPKASSKKLSDGQMVTAPLEDMAPFLNREELHSNMLVQGYGSCHF